MPASVGNAIGYPRFFVGFQPSLIKSIGVEMAPTKRIGENVLANNYEYDDWQIDYVRELEWKRQ